MAELHFIAGIAAGILSFLAYPKYLYEIVRGHTKPSRVTWWVLSLSNALIAVTYYSSGARDTIWIPISYTIGFLTVGILSLKYGEGNWKRTDLIYIVGACISAGIWFFLRSPEFALYAIIVVDFLGLLPTIIKSYKRPKTEDKGAWILGTTASLINVLAIETWTAAVAFYPFYVFLTNALIVLFLYRTRRPLA